MPARTGDVIAGQYRIEEHIGEGNMGVVYRARHAITGQLCALKLVHRHLVTNQEILDLFIKETQVGILLGANPYIVHVFDAGIDRARTIPYLAMELLEGESLDEYLYTRGPVPAALVCTLVEQLAHALDHAHRACVVHRDLKPANLFLTLDRTGFPVLKVVDFGIAKVLEQDAESTGTEVGTPVYAAPEQLGPAVRRLAAANGITVASHVSPQTDIWAMGLTIYQLLTGLPAWRYWADSSLMNQVDLAMRIALEEPPVASIRAGEQAERLPPGFDGWLARCLRKNAVERWRSAGEAMRAFMALFDEVKLFDDEDEEPVEEEDEDEPPTLRWSSPSSVPAALGTLPAGAAVLGGERRSSAPAAPGTVAGGAAVLGSERRSSASAAPGTLPAGAAVVRIERPSSAPAASGGGPASMPASAADFRTSTLVSAGVSVPPPSSDVNAELAAAEAQPQKPRRISLLLGIALFSAVLSALILFVVVPRKGQLRIEVLDTHGMPVSRANIFVDEYERCQVSPCVVAALDAGPARIRVVPWGMSKVISAHAAIRANEETTVQVTVPAVAVAVAAPVVQKPPPSGSHLKIAGSQPGVQVFVDGVHRGSLPLELQDVAAGAHRIRLDAGERYQPLETSVEIRPGESIDLGTVQLQVIRGLVTFDVITPGARVMLMRRGANGATQWRAIDTWNKQSVTADVEGEGWTVLATKNGYRDFRRMISFEDGVAEKTIQIALAPVSFRYR